MATQTIDVAARRAELAAELAELDAVEARQAAEGAVDTLTSWLNDPASVTDLGAALTVLRDAVVAADPNAWPNTVRQRAPRGSGKGSTSKPKRGPFDADAVVAFLKEQAEPVVMRRINNALNMQANSADMVPLAEAGAISITGKAPQFKYAAT